MPRVGFRIVSARALNSGLSLTAAYSCYAVEQARASVKTAQETVKTVQQTQKNAQRSTGIPSKICSIVGIVHMDNGCNSTALRAAFQFSHSQKSST